MVSSAPTSPTQLSRAPRERARRQSRDLLDRLRLLVHYSSESPRRIEARAGLRLGYLSQILQGRLELKLDHALALIHALGFEPEEVFEGLFSAPRPEDRGPGPACRRRDGTQALALELAKSYGLGLDSLDDLLRRLERYEAELRERDLRISENPGRWNQRSVRDTNRESKDSPSSAGPRSSASLRDG